MIKWHSIEDGLPDVTSGIYKVRLDNGEEKNAYFYKDRIGWITFYGYKSCYWWDKSGNKDPLHNVTHWREGSWING